MPNHGAISQHQWLHPSTSASTTKVENVLPSIKSENVLPTINVAQHQASQPAAVNAATSTGSLDFAGAFSANENQHQYQSAVTTNASNDSQRRMSILQHFEYKISNGRINGIRCKYCAWSTEDEGFAPSALESHIYGGKCPGFNARMRSNGTDMRGTASQL